MKKLSFTLNINAPATKVWRVLWDDITYRKWTRAFTEGSHAVSDWKEGSKIQFLSADGSGIYGVIAEYRPAQYIAFKHQGIVKNFAEQPNDEETKLWNGAMETYSLKEENGSTQLDCTMDATDEFEEYMRNTFPKAMALLKELAEQPLMLTVEATVNAPVEKVWDTWSNPKHITQWCNASDDWHAPRAENDLRTGGKFLTRMEAKDGSFGFDFEGIYTDVKPLQHIAYALGDARTVEIIFEAKGEATHVTENFVAENENPQEMQLMGWQMILNNFKKYTESNLSKHD